MAIVAIAGLVVAVVATTIIIMVEIVDAALVTRLSTLRAIMVPRTAHHHGGRYAPLASLASRLGTRRRWGV